MGKTIAVPLTSYASHDPTDNIGLQRLGRSGSQGLPIFCASATVGVCNGGYFAATKRLLVDFITGSHRICWSKRFVIWATSLIS